MFKKILIANRGEIAVRIIRACHEMRIRTVAVYSTADAQSIHVRLADESVCVGPPPNKDSYLNAPNIISAAQITGAEAIHPGYAYFSEQASFADACERCNLTFIGPPAAAIEKMGDKARAREIAQSVNVPVIPGSTGTVANDQEAARLAGASGYPLLVKAVAGGGGRGIRLVQNEEDLPKALAVARMEAESSFGNGEIYIEKFLEEPRHIEVQILADQHGHINHLGERECSVQTQRHQKMLEESPSPLSSQSLRNRMGEAAVRIAKAVGYTNAGTVEFLVDAKGNFFFLEMNTRLQVEHPVTEAVTGIDIVKEQIRLAAGEKLSYSQKEVKLNGHSIECRITAEDPDRNFAPSAGQIESLYLPGGLGVRIDTHIYAGYEVSPFYDPMIAKLIVWAPDRTTAIARMSRCLHEFEITGISTNVGLQQRILNNAFFRRGDLSTDFIQRRLLNGSS